MKADGGTAPEFYVKLKLSGKEMRTKTVRDSNSIRFMEDLRMDLEDDDDLLIVELLQVGVLLTRGARSSARPRN